MIYHRKCTNSKGGWCAASAVWWVIWAIQTRASILILNQSNCKYIVYNPWWRHQMETFPRYWPLVWGIHRSPVNSPHKGQWRGALMFSLICVWINGWVNNGEAGDLRRYRAHYDVILMPMQFVYNRYLHIRYSIWRSMVSVRPFSNSQLKQRITPWTPPLIQVN